MKKQLYIVGAGHAGSSAALSAARAIKEWEIQDIEIHIIDKSSFLTIRPRLYEYEIEECHVELNTFLSPLNIIIHQDEIVKIDTEKHLIIGGKNTYFYDSAIFCLGSELSSKNNKNIDNYRGALQLKHTLDKLVYTHSELNSVLNIAVLGAGFTGIELACELPLSIEKSSHKQNVNLPEFNITVFDKHNIGYALGENPAPIILEALALANCRLISNTQIVSTTQNEVHYMIDNKRYCEVFDLVIWTLGQVPQHLVNILPFEKDNIGRVRVSSYLSCVSSPEFFVAGDCASVLVDDNHYAVMSCQHARPQGRYAGHNAVAFLANQTQEKYTQANYVTCLSLGRYGAVYTEGWERKVVKRGCLAKQTKQHINKVRLYPPVNGDIQALYREGELEFKTPLETE